MKKTDLIKLIEKLNDEDNVNEILKGTDIEETFKTDPSLDTFKNLIATNKDFMRFMDSEKDKHSSKALETWKSNNLQTLINDEVLKATGKKKTPEQLKIEELEKKFAEQEARANKAESVSKYKGVLAEKNIPLEMIDYFLTEDDDTTNKRIDNFSTYLNDMVSKGVEDKIKAGNYTPPGEDGDGMPSADDIAKLML